MVSPAMATTAVLYCTFFPRCSMGIRQSRPPDSRQSTEVWTIGLDPYSFRIVPSFWTWILYPWGESGPDICYVSR